MVQTILGGLYNDELNRRDDDWVQFLLDHRRNLIANSTLHEITEKEMVYYRYRLRKFLDERYGAGGLELAVLITNRYKTAMDFNIETRSIRIPELGYVKELRDLYRVNQVQLSKYSMKL